MSETTIERHASIEARASVEADSILKYFKKCDYITSLTGSDLSENKGMYLALSLTAFAQSEVCRELARLRIEISTSGPLAKIKVPVGAAGWHGCQHNSEPGWTTSFSAPPDAGG